MGKKRDPKPVPLWADNVCEDRTCGQCRHLTNVPDEQRSVPNVMGGCFVDGHITFTDEKACNEFDEFKNETDN